MKGIVRQAGRAGTRGGRIVRGTAVRRGFYALLAAFLYVGEGGGNIALAQTVTGVTARQRWPWNNLIDIDYTVSGMTATNGLYIRFEVSDPSGGWTKADALDQEPPLTDGPHRVTWDPGADNIRRFRADGIVCQAVLKRDDPHRYLVIDLSGGKGAEKYPFSYLPAAPVGGWTDEYKTTKLAMRKIDPGTFMMGSPATETGRDKSKEAHHSVTLTNAFYIGVFPVTQRQYEQVTGTTPSTWKANGACCPVEYVTYNSIRGAAPDIDWPETGTKVSVDGFLGLVREKAGLKGFDLPTEAQWEYACRAGTTNALNSGKNLSNATSCSEMNEVGHYQYNGGKRQNEGGKWEDVGPVSVGLYKPNAWGLYDMHGNVWEWCRDWYTNYLGTAAVTEPSGPSSGPRRVAHGGSWDHPASSSRSAARINVTPSFSSPSVGFRPVCSAK